MVRARAAQSDHATPVVRTESFEVARTLFPAGRATPLHEHADAHLVIVVSGVWEDSGPAGVWSLGPGEILFHPAGIRHRTRVMPPGAEIVMAHTAPSVIARFCPLYGNVPRSIHLRCDRLEHVPELLLEELMRCDVATPAVVEGLLMQLLAIGSRVLTQDHAAPEWLARVLEIMRADYAKRLTIAGLSRAVGISESRLVHGFREITGRSVRDFLRDVRVSAAARALLATSDAIGDIAVAVGFYDQAHLSKSFKALKGVTPLAYRRVNSRKQRG